MQVRSLFTTRAGGCSRPPYDSANLGLHVGDDPVAVRENRARVGRPDRPVDVVFADQVHGAQVALVRSARSEPVPGVDALVCDVPGLAVAILVADCVPVVLGDETAGVVAVVHAGRAGLVAGVVPAAVEAMRGVGAVPSRIRARLGPAIGGCCYEVPAALRASVTRVAPSSWAQTSWGTPSVDIRAGVHEQLEGVGVGDIEVSPICTREDPRYFSYRRDPVTGRFAGVAWLVDA